MSIPLNQKTDAWNCLSHYNQNSWFPVFAKYLIQQFGFKQQEKLGKYFIKKIFLTCENEVYDVSLQV